MDDANPVTTRLLTLLNVSATKIGKRKRPYEEDNTSHEKPQKRRSLRFADSEKNTPDTPVVTEVVVNGDKQEAEGETDGALDSSFANAHFYILDRHHGAV